MNELEKSAEQIKISIGLAVVALLLIFFGIYEVNSEKENLKTVSEHAIDLALYIEIDAGCGDKFYSSKRRTIYQIREEIEMRENFSRILIPVAKNVDPKSFKDICKIEKAKLELKNEGK